jgi:hypothetical protein
MNPIDVERANRFVLAKQHLTPAARSDDACAVTRHAAGLHATTVSTPYLSLFARMTDFSKADLERELYERRTLAKIRCVRKTIYIQPADMIPAFYAATARVVAGASERFMQARGVSQKQFERARSEILEMLHHTEMTASQIKNHLSTDIDVSSILYMLCDRGELIRARPLSWRDKRHTYARFRDYFPDLDLHTHAEDEAKRAIVSYYLATFGPATETDVVWWTGFGKRDVKRALQEISEQITRIALISLPGEYMLFRSDENKIEQPQVEDEPVVSFLPVLDSFLMGYKQRERFISAEHREFAFDRSGNATSTIVVTGRVVGVWDYGLLDTPSVKVYLFEKVGDAILGRIEEQARLMSRFVFGEDVDIVYCASMTPLTERTAGSMMSPLKSCA